MGGGTHFWDAIVTITAGIALVAIVALIVSKKSQTPAVIQAGGTAYSSALAVAVSPVTGAVPQANLTYPNEGFLSGGGGGFTPDYGNGMFG
jgi:hypothetical protein